MASTSFLNLTNTLLRRINEVEIDQADFASTRGVHALAKDAINAAIYTINQTEMVWPFNASVGTQVLDVSVEEYNWPTDMLIPNWQSFYVVADDALNEDGGPIEYIPREVWLKKQKQFDEASDPDGLQSPLWVFEKHGMGFGISPSPDQAYTVTYEYWALPVRLVNYNDVPTIPSNFDEVIVQGGLYHMYMFRDNTEQALVAKKEFDRLLANMRSVLINKSDQIISTFISKPTGTVKFGIPVNGWY